MISSMREYFRSLKFILVIIVIAFVATSVVYFGTGDSGSGGTPNIVGTVNGEEIPTERFRRTQANLIEQYERMTRQRLTPEMIERLGLNQRVMNELVNDTLVVQAAGREGVRVSDDELRSRIQEMREFQQDGRFSRDRYHPRPQAGAARARELRDRDAPPAHPQEDRGPGQGRRQGLRCRAAGGLLGAQSAGAHGVGLARHHAAHGGGDGAGRGPRALREGPPGAVHAARAPPDPVRRRERARSAPQADLRSGRPGLLQRAT